jgi:hypothetical protein
MKFYAEFTMSRVTSRLWCEKKAWRCGSLGSDVNRLTALFDKYASGTGAIAIIPVMSCNTYSARLSHRFRYTGLTYALTSGK